MLVLGSVLLHVDARAGSHVGSHDIFTAGPRGPRGDPINSMLSSPVVGTLTPWALAVTSLQLLHSHGCKQEKYGGP